MPVMPVVISKLLRNYIYAFLLQKSVSYSILSLTCSNGISRKMEENRAVSSCNDNNKELDGKEGASSDANAFCQGEAIAEITPPGMSKRALKRQARAQKYKELQKKRKTQNLILTRREDAGYNLEDFDQTNYYFEKGLRKVYPYPYVFATHAKGRWVGRTIKDVLGREFQYDLQDDLDKAFQSGKINVNNHVVDKDYVIKNCDYISHQIHRHENPVTAAQLEVLADTSEVLVVNKPASIPCHPCGRYRFNSVVFILGKELGYTNLRNIYRLDRLTSGVLVLGKTDESTKRLEDHIVNRQVQKEYLCRVVGKFPDGEVIVEQPLQALSNKLRLQIVTPKGKHSKTTFHRLSFNGRSSVVKCYPHTGRTHQIRVHLQYLGHPIINDVFYNCTAWGPNKGKSGDYEVPFDKVCEKILCHHHVTQWDAGENPLYHVKLQQMQSITAKSTSQSPLEKRMQSEESGERDEENSADALPAAEEEKCSHYSNSPDVALASKSSTSIKTNCHTKETEMIHVTRDGPEDTSNTTEICAPTSDLSTKTMALNLPGFEMDKWIVDTTCELCKKRCLDPQEKDLVMFLHALKYKGPGWEYETSVPDWAQEGWCDESSYVPEGMTYHCDV